MILVSRFNDSESNILNTYILYMYIRCVHLSVWANSSLTILSGDCTRGNVVNAVSVSLVKRRRRGAKQKQTTLHCFGFFVLCCALKRMDTTFIHIYVHTYICMYAFILLLLLLFLMCCLFVHFVYLHDNL